MLEARFSHYDLKLVEPAFGSALTDLIIELDYLRKKKLGGSTHPKVFFQLKHIFHTLESIGSARIEGNNTTIAEYIETKLSGNKKVPPSVREIQNIEKAMAFIEENVNEYPINRAFLSEMHKKIVDGLLPPPDGEGDLTPGEYRKINLGINKSTHKPPEWLRVDDYMNELLDFVNKEDSPKYDLLKAAIAHHRFVWIHPFGNGNGIFVFDQQDEKMKPLQIKDPKNMQIAIQQEIHRSDDSKYDHRLHGLLLVLHGFDCYTVGKLFGQNPTTIQRWVRNFNSQGFSGLTERNKPGRPSSLSEKQWSQLGNDLRKAPTHFSYSQSFWDGKLMSAHLEKKYKVEIGVRQCQRIFNAMGFRQRKPRPLIANADPKARKAFKKTDFDGKKQSQ
jgi:transposase/fido (protein-threonine AMPylation protein)